MVLKKWLYTAMLIAISFVGSSFIFVPVGFAKIAPVQHLVNLVSAVILGPGYAVAQAFGTSVLRNLFGTGTVFAFPGSMVGALCAGMLYKYTKKFWLAAVGEIVGTGILGALICYPIARLFLTQQMTIWVFIPSFFLSSLIGALIGFAILRKMDTRLKLTNRSLFD
ncbi:energy coupling factor transporter S component ThiW [Listeria newyorkensis]|uniref:Energy coupling factor transporter S component ThiW n=2 Tax=Listeria newyorkensis TaxID=1497681 RepID=A0ABX4XNW0_9LIST|nr:MULTISPECIES: energy coupling factor transporter S component ThiW [Listeria]KGL45280.1 thiW protein [Listeriaceae bacterium FSL A5-0209]KGL40174.1 thiW protein [Listeria newyorkensis]PNP93452.1 energy coupling factor transporter S component ThiW [Listeria newyorkensis]RQW68087.1 energy coupling factor transporter S component ThiW [Listeria sp. SHR_NRA_18]SQC55886.1 Predicted membrane protein [Listeria newyorkensis]